MADSGAAAAAATGCGAQQHVFGTCDLCGEESDQSIASLVLVQCNQRDCKDRVYHQDCLLDYIESASTSRRTFYLKKQAYFDLAGFFCVENRHEASDPRHCRGKIQSSTQLRELKKKPKAPVAPAKPAPAARDASCGHRKATRLPPAGVKRLVPRAPAAAPAAAAAAEEGPKVPVGWEPVDEEPSPRTPRSPRAPAAPAASGGGSVPWWLARVEAPAKRDAPAEAEEGSASERCATEASDCEAAGYHQGAYAYESADDIAIAPAPVEEVEQPESPQERAHDDAAPPAPLPAVPASQHGLSAASAALAANAGVRSLFRAALASVAANGLLPLPNASRLSDLMAALDPSWAVQRKKYAPFSRLFWAYAADVAAAGLALVPACDGFALIANGHGSGHGNGSGNGNGGGGVKPSSAAPGAAATGAGAAPVVLRRAAVAEATDVQAAAIAASYEARLVASLSNGYWRLLSMLGDRDRGCPVPANLGCSLKQFIVARPARFELRWADEAWQVRLLPAPPRQPPQPPMQQQQQQEAPPLPPMQPLPPMPAMPIAPNPFAMAQQQAALPPRPAMPPPGFQQAASFSSILPPPGFAVAEPPAQAGPPASYSLFSAPFPFLPPPAASAQAAEAAAPHAGVTQQRHLYEPFVPYAPQPPSSLPANAVYAQSWEPPQQPATSRAIFPSPMWSAAGREAPPLQRTVSAPAESYGAPSTTQQQQQQQQQASLLRNGAPLPAPQRMPGNGNTTSPRTGRVLPAPRLPAQNGGQKTLPQPRVLPPAPRPAGQAVPLGGYDMMPDTGDADQDAARHEQLVAMLLDLDFD